MPRCRRIRLDRFTTLLLDLVFLKLTVTLESRFVLLQRAKKIRYMVADTADQNHDYSNIYS
jgi:hypothetical protein